MTLHLPSHHLHAIATHAQHTYPEECCGLLLGVRDSLQTQVIAIQATPNAWTADVEAEMSESLGSDPQPLSKTRRYWIDPRDVLDAQRSARQQNLDIIGIYHSHTDHVAVPSECDRRCAWSGYAYVIVSVYNGVMRDYRCWNLDDQQQFQPEEIRISEEVRS